MSKLVNQQIINKLLTDGIQIANSIAKGREQLIEIAQNLQKVQDAYRKNRQAFMEKFKKNT